MVLLNLVVNGVTLMFAVVSAVTGAFGMNLNAWMPQGTKSSAVRVQSVEACCSPNLCGSVNGADLNVVGHATCVWYGAE